MFLTSHTTAAYSDDGDDYNKEDYPPYDSNNGRNGVCGISHHCVTVLKIWIQVYKNKIFQILKWHLLEIAPNIILQEFKDAIKL